MSLVEVYIKLPGIETPIFRAICDDQEWPDHDDDPEDGPDFTAADLYDDFEPEEADDDER